LKLKLKPKKSAKKPTKQHVLLKKPKRTPNEKDKRLKKLSD